MTFKIDVTDQPILTALQEAKAKLQDLTPIMRNIGIFVQASTKRRFTEEISPSGTPWKKSRRAKEQGGQTLSDTGRLRNSITFLAGKDSVAIGTSVPYGKYHQFGTAPYVILPKSKKVLKFTIGGKVIFAKRVNHTGLPKREFLGLSEQDKTQIISLVKSYLGT